MGEDPLDDGRGIDRGDELHPPGTEDQILSSVSF